MPEIKQIVATNIDAESDDLYHNDRGSWNVTRAWRDCLAGKHALYTLDVEEAYEANAAVEVDQAKVWLFKDKPDVLAKPCIGIVEDGRLWFIEGHHRLRALHLIGQKDFQCYVIEEADSQRYIVLWNGQRRPPFRPY